MLLQLPKWRTFGEELKKFRNSSTKERKGERRRSDHLPSPLFIWHWWKWPINGSTVITHGQLSSLCRIVVLAGDTLPIDVYCHLPVMCEDRNLPYAYIPSKVVSKTTFFMELLDVWRCCWFAWPLFWALLLGPGIISRVKEANLCDPDQTSWRLSGFLQWVSGGGVQPSQTPLKRNPVKQELTCVRSVKTSFTSRSPLFCFHIWTWSGCNGTYNLSWRVWLSNRFLQHCKYVFLFYIVILIFSD